MDCMKLLGQRLMARDFDRQVTEIQSRVAVLNGFAAPGLPVIEVVGWVCQGKGEARSSDHLCSRTAKIGQ